MDNKHDFVQVKLENNYQLREIKAQKAMQFRIDQNKQVVVYSKQCLTRCLDLDPK